MNNKLLLITALTTALSGITFAQENTQNVLAPSIDAMQFCERNCDLKECTDFAEYSEELSHLLQNGAELTPEQRAHLAALHTAITQKISQETEVGIKETSSEISE